MEMTVSDAGWLPFLPLLVGLAYAAAAGALAGRLSRRALWALWGAAALAAVAVAFVALRPPDGALAGVPPEARAFMRRDLGLMAARLAGLAVAAPAALATWAVLRAAGRPRPVGAAARVVLGVLVFAVGAAAGLVGAWLAT